MESPFADDRFADADVPGFPPVNAFPDAQGSPC
jgi:hypothetical protein